MTDEQRPWVTWPEYERALTALHGVFGAVEAERTRAEAAEAQRDRLVAALRQMYAEYEGDDDDWDEGWRDPDNVDDGTVTVAMPFVVLAQARAALADVPDALARQVEEG